MRWARSSCGTWGRWLAWRSQVRLFFVGQPANKGWESPAKLGTTSARIEVFCDDPDAFEQRLHHSIARTRIHRQQDHVGRDDDDRKRITQATPLRAGTGTVQHGKFLQ